MPTTPALFGWRFGACANIALQCRALPNSRNRKNNEMVAPPLKNGDRLYHQKVVAGKKRQPFGAGDVITGINMVMESDIE